MSTQTMIGEMVEHPQYGRRQIVAIYRNGAEWMVRFDNGLRFRRPRHEFNGQQESVVSLAPPALPPATAPMSRTQFEARELVEALRVGIAPVQHIRELTIGLAEERTNPNNALNRTHQQGGAVRTVLGDYGFGKSHIVELVTQEALDRKFLVASASLDLTELPPHKALDIYATLMHHLRYPDSDERGLLPLLEAAADLPRMPHQLQDLTVINPDPLALTVGAIKNTTASRQRQAWSEWLMGGRRAKSMNVSMPSGIKFPSIYRQGNNARQIAYLLNGVSVLARIAGYSGLCLLIDEAESYSLLRASQRLKADQFFSAVIYAALQGQSCIQPGSLLQHHVRNFPPAYGGKQSLFFLFTATHSDNPMPLQDWLAADQIIELNPHQTPQEIGQFLQQTMGYHAQAYGYESGERQGQVRRAAAEHLALGMRNVRLSIRGVVRLAVELFDLLYLYPEYEVATLLDDLRNLVR